MKKSRKLIRVVNLSELRAAKWLLAVGEDVKSLRPYLEKLGYRVITIESGLDDEEIHELLLEKKVDFFITKNGKGIEHYFRRWFVYNTLYSLIWIFQDVLLDDLYRLAQTIEKAIMYDPYLRDRSRPEVRRITGKYITDLVKIKRYYQKQCKQTSLQQERMWDFL